MRATYNVPFPDFDYEKLAKDCGATCAYQRGDELIVTGTPEVIKMISANLDFGPDGSSFDDIDEWLDDNDARRHAGELTESQKAQLAEWVQDNIDPEDLK